MLTNYIYLSFDQSDLKFHYERLAEADKETLPPEDLEAFYKIRYFPVSIDVVPDDCKNAVIAIEDKTFYENNGVDPKGLARLSLSMFTFGRFGGGSTISQQVVKLTRDRFYKRNPVDKYIEIVRAVKLNSSDSKDKILEMYINNVYMGDYNYGFQAASLDYFDKNVWELSLEECAYLAGIPQLPNGYRPIDGKFPEDGLERQDEVLKALRKL